MIGRGSLVHDLMRRPGQLDAVAMHDERDRRLVEAGRIESVQRLTGDPAGVAAVADDEGVGAVTCAQPERQSGCDRHRHAEPARTDRRAARQPRHVTGDVEAAPEPRR